MEQEFKDKLSNDATFQAQVLDILKGTEVGKAYTETVAKNYFEQNIGSEHRKIYNFVDSALISEGFDKPEGVKTSEWVNMIAKQNKELSDKIQTMSSNPDQLSKELEGMKEKHKKEKAAFNKAAQAEIERRDQEIKNLKSLQNKFLKEKELQKELSKLTFNKSLDQRIIDDVKDTKIMKLIHNAQIKEDGSVVWCKDDGEPYLTDGLLHTSLEDILTQELHYILHKSTPGGNAGTHSQPGTSTAKQIIVDPARFKTQEQFLAEFQKVAQSKGIAKGDKYDSLYWEAFERYEVSSLKEY